jgi:hypothetical protein
MAAIKRFRKSDVWTVAATMGAAVSLFCVIFMVLSLAIPIGLLWAGLRRRHRRLADAYGRV